VEGDYIGFNDHDEIMRRAEMRGYTLLRWHWGIDFVENRPQPHCFCLFRTPKGDVCSLLAYNVRELATLVDTLGAPPLFGERR
jgi:hypothetical protein